MTELEETGKRISENLDKALFKIKNDMSADGIKAAKALLAEADYQIQQYERQEGHHSDISRSAKALSSKLGSEIANQPSERDYYL